MPTSLENYFPFSPFFANANRMSDLEWERLQDKIDRLPQELADFLVDSKTANFIRNLALSKNVDPRLGTEIAAIIRSIVIADLSIGDLVTNLRDQLGTNQDLAHEIANVIVSHLFLPIIEDLKKIQAEKLRSKINQRPTLESQSLHEQNIGNVVDLRNKS